jgi:predicted metalloprotease
LPEAAYLAAHAYGHAVQVQHGVADFALGQIRNRRNEEAMLRGLVARQVDCIAGFLVARAGLPNASLTDWFEDKPFAGVHWGRDPLRIGPVVSIGLASRDDWFQRGQGGDLAVCGPGEFTADLLIDALRP